MNINRALRLVALSGCLTSALFSQQQEDHSMRQTFRLSKIGVIMLGVTDLQRSIAFYRDHLGLELASNSDEFAFFNAGGVTLALSKDLTTALGKEPGAVEVVFSVDHIQPAYVGLQRNGVRFSGPPKVITGRMWAANFADPDGHTLSIFGPE